MKSKKRQIIRNRSHKLKGGNKYQIPLDKLTLEQICNQAGFNQNSDNPKVTLDQLNKKSSSLSGGMVDKIKYLGSAVTWFPRKVFNVALNTTGMDKIIYSEPDSVYDESNSNTNNESNSNINNESNSNSNLNNNDSNLKNVSFKCIQDVDKLCNSCSEPEQLLVIHNKVTNRIKSLNKNFFDDKYHLDIDNLNTVKIDIQKGGYKRSHKKNIKRKRKKSSLKKKM